MLTIRNLTALAVAAVLTAGAGSAQAAKGKKKSVGDKHLHGVVVAVQHEKDGSGTFEIETKAHKKGGQPSEVKLHKFTFNSSTKFEIVHDGEHKPATAAALRKGDHVVVAEKAHHADVVAIHHHAKAKNKPKKS